MEEPKFKNKENKELSVKFGDLNITYFVSRSVAVVGVVFAINEHNEIYVLTGVRSSSMIDESNKVCLPCGYLDWNESAYDAMIREVYEETSLYLPNYLNSDYLVFDNAAKPFEIIDDPSKDARQNVSMLYMTILGFRRDIFPSFVEQYTSSETSKVMWLKLSDLFATNFNSVDGVDLNWAFNHNETIQRAYKYFKLLW